MQLRCVDHKVVRNKAQTRLSSIKSKIRMKCSHQCPKFHYPIATSHYCFFQFNFFLKQVILVYSNSFFFFFAIRASPILAKSPMPQRQNKIRTFLSYKIKIFLYTQLPFTSYKFLYTRQSQMQQSMNLACRALQHFHLEPNVDGKYFRLTRQNRVFKVQNISRSDRKENDISSCLKGTPRCLQESSTSHLHTSTAASQPPHQHLQLCGALRISPLDSLCELQKMKEETS